MHFILLQFKNSKNLKKLCVLIKVIEYKYVQTNNSIYLKDGQ